MKKLLILSAALLALTGCAKRLTCEKSGHVVYDSGRVGWFQTVHKGDRNDHWNVGWWKTYTPEPGADCEASWR